MKNLSEITVQIDEALRSHQGRIRFNLLQAEIGISKVQLQKILDLKIEFGEIKQDKQNNIITGPYFYN